MQRHQRIWAVLDKVRAKHPDMVLLHGGSPRGAERIAACWADNRKVAQVVFKPDWARHRNAAPFKRNDQMLEALPIGVIAFPGSGNLPQSEETSWHSGVALHRTCSGETGRRVAAVSRRKFRKVPSGQGRPAAFGELHSARVRRWACRPCPFPPRRACSTVRRAFQPTPMVARPRARRVASLTGFLKRPGR